MKECLIIVESPTKERVLKEMLGDGFQITSSKGHVKDLPKSRLGIDIDNHFKPTWVIIPGKRQMMKNLKNLATGKERIFLATDPDREGEAISWHIAKELNIERYECRIIFNEITENVIRKSIEHPRKLNTKVINSQIARRLLDRLVGYQVSPLCYKFARGKSAGRVQSVAVHLIVKREKEIEAFQPEEFWKIHAFLIKKNDVKENAFGVLLASKNGKKIHIANAKEAKALCQEIKEYPFIVSEIRNKKEYKHPPLPFKTSTLQQFAYQQLNFSVKRTMRVAQQLYEGISITGRGTLGLITYMRTDSTRISDEAKKNARKYILSNFGQDYVSSGKLAGSKKSKTGTKVQDAHEAIRPTSVYLHPKTIQSDLSSDQFKLYQLIWKVFIASQMKSTLLERSNIKIQAKEFIFELSGTKIQFPGYLKMLGDSDMDKTCIPKLKEGEKLELIKLDPKQSFTKPPARYNEASLVKVLEKEGIGRPSTYSVIIDKILSRGYVEKENKKLVPTKLGMVVDQFLIDYFSNIINIKFTANMESKLDKIESGSHDWKKILNDFYQLLLQDIHRLNQKPPQKLIQQIKEFSDEKCPICGNQMEVKNGPYGKYLACSKFPIKHPKKPYVIKINVPCPENDCDGEMIQLKSKKGKKFYGCSNYPQCKFYSIHMPINQRCPKCDSILVKIDSKRKGNFYHCSSKKCDYQKKVSKDE